MKIISPLYIEMGKIKIKRYYLNLNAYRNRHFIVNWNLKKLYKEIIQSQIEKLPIFDWELKFTYTYYHPTKRKSDMENVCIIHNKFLQDAIVESWKIVDDNYTIIKEITYRYWWYDKNNGRVEVEIESFN